jgi:hypothetical protein
MRSDVLQVTNNLTRVAIIQLTSPVLPFFRLLLSNCFTFFFIFCHSTSSPCLDSCWTDSFRCSMNMAKCMLAVHRPIYALNSFITIGFVHRILSMKPRAQHNVFAWKQYNFINWNCLCQKLRCRLCICLLKCRIQIVLFYRQNEFCFMYHSTSEKLNFVIG